MQNAHTRKTVYTFFLYFTTDLQRRSIFKTEQNLKNPFRTSLDATAQSSALRDVYKMMVLTVYVTDGKTVLTNHRRAC